MEYLKKLRNKAIMTSVGLILAFGIVMGCGVLLIEREHIGSGIVTLFASLAVEVYFLYVLIRLFFTERYLKEHLQDLYNYYGFDLDEEAHTGEKINANLIISDKWFCYINLLASRKNNYILKINEIDSVRFGKQRSGKAVNHIVQLTLKDGHNLAVNLAEKEIPKVQALFEKIGEERRSFETAVEQQQRFDSLEATTETKREESEAPKEASFMEFEQEKETSKRSGIVTVIGMIVAIAVVVGLFSLGYAGIKEMTDSHHSDNFVNTQNESENPPFDSITPVTPDDEHYRLYLTEVAGDETGIEVSYLDEEDGTYFFAITNGSPYVIEGEIEFYNTAGRSLATVDFGGCRVDDWCYAVVPMKMEPDSYELKNLIYYDFTYPLDENYQYYLEYDYNTESEEWYNVVLMSGKNFDNSEESLQQAIDLAKYEYALTSALHQATLLQALYFYDENAAYYEDEDGLLWYDRSSAIYCLKLDYFSGNIAVYRVKGDTLELDRYVEMRETE